VPIDATTASVDSQLQALLAELSKAAAAVQPGTAAFGGMKVYGVLVDFDQLPASTEAERTLRDEVKAVPTSWTLTPDQLGLVERVGPLLLERDPCFRALLEDLGAPAPQVDAPLSTDACITKIRS